MDLHVYMVWRFQLIKLGFSNIFNLINKLHISEKWKLQYGGIESNILRSEETDKIVEFAQQALVSGTNLRIQKALPPPCGSPPKNAGKRYRECYERETAHRRTKTHS